MPLALPLEKHKYRRPYLPRELPAPLTEFVEIEEILGRVAPIDFVAALAGLRGAAFHISSEAAA